LARCGGRCSRAASSTPSHAAADDSLAHREKIAIRHPVVLEAGCALAADIAAIRFSVEK
jgi:hypothetical protein